jgi:hypothetical protein
MGSMPVLAEGTPVESTQEAVQAPAVRLTEGIPVAATPGVDVWLGVDPATTAGSLVRAERREDSVARSPTCRPSA